MYTRLGIGKEAGAIIRRLRGEAVSQGALALRAGTSQSYISRLEAGEINPTVEQIDHLLNCLGYRLKLEPEPLTQRSDPASYAEQLAMSPEERMQSAAAIQNTVVELRSALAG